jgi:hypothetical protein
MFNNNRFDLVIGDVNCYYKRPCIKDPELVMEFKAFPRGFTSPQHYVHYRYVIDERKGDIAKLAKLMNPQSNRYLLLYDEDNYLEQYDSKTHASRIKRIVKLRDEKDPLIKIIYLSRQGKKNTGWKKLWHRINNEISNL